MADTTSPGSSDDRLNAILLAWLRAVEAGEQPDEDALCAAHPEFAAEMRQFFADNRRMAKAFDPPDSGTEPTIDSDRGTGGGEHDRTVGLPAGRPRTLGIKVRYFGDYELLQEIAHGGMGVVYKARQSRLGRIVALKMILSGRFANDADVQRFYAEAKSAAVLAHPGIVPVFEVGQHEGLHFYSMAYVEGESLSRLIADGPLEVRRAAEILSQVAEAVEYAHQHGVVHRDIKPSNVLLDASGAPRLTDFGLAKRLEADDQITTTGQILGTPGYMPPEQAAGIIDAVGPASDIYALGALLYCLITGRPPFQAAHVVDTLIQVIHREPPAPRELNATIPRDVETICLKCLRKDASQRYGSAQELADDLQRWLRGEPIRARPVGRIERGVKWVRRHPVTTALVAAIGLSLLGGTVVSTYFAIEADKQRGAEAEARNKAEGLARRNEKLAKDEHAAREVAEQRRQEAEAASLRAQVNFAMARDAVDRFLVKVSEDRRLKGEGLEPLRRDLLDTAAQFFTRFVEQAGDDPDLLAEKARAQGNLANIRAQMDDGAGAIAMMRQALADYEQLAQKHPQNLDYQIRTAHAYGSLGTLHHRLAQVPEAEAAFSRAVALNKPLVDAKGSTEARRQLALTYNNYGGFLQDCRKLKEAAEMFRECIRIREELIQEDPADWGTRLNLAGARSNYGAFLRRAGQFVESEKVIQAAIDDFTALAGQFPSDPDYQDSTAKAYSDLGVTLYQHGEMPRAETAYREAHQRWEELARVHPQVAHYQHRVAGSYGNIGLLYQQTGRPQEADEAYVKSVAVLRRLANEYPTVTMFVLDFGGNLDNVGHLRRDTGKLDEALAAFDEGTAALAKLHARHPSHPTVAASLQDGLAGRAYTKHLLKQFDEALLDWDRALALPATRSNPFLMLEQAKTREAFEGEIDALLKDRKLAEAVEKLHRFAARVEQPDGMFYLAGVTAQRLALLGEEEKATADALAAIAIDLLQRAQQQGLFEKAVPARKLRADDVWKPLRERDDFQAIIKALPE